MLKDEERNKIAKILSERIGNFTCPICKRGHFSLIDGYSSYALTDNYRKINIDGKIIPFTMLVCDNCGFITQHALGTIGLIDRTDSNEAETK